MTHIKRYILTICCLIASVWISGCAYKASHSYMVPEAPSHSAKHYYQPEMSQLSVKAYTYMLADELLLSVNASQVYGNVAVTRFVAQDNRTDSIASGAPLKHLGGQLEEGFIYELQKRGFKVIDYKLTGHINVTGQGDLIWSRDTKELAEKVDVKYVLAGTMTPHQKGAIVNIRLMNMLNKQVVATAQGFMPENLFWAEQAISLQDGVLIHKGERPRVYGAGHESIK
ncbi:FlgO family outer membrane protein [Catenovulum sediminis]|uniref:FlgO family outer membrane protein n=1 Tax=Catenovulum sediminis TaxID=1740262 RepID=A0ABV1RGK7_9ALTE|nr:FlgO family outer membrane protein [Catenovulum sediminis]